MNRSYSKASETGDRNMVGLPRSFVGAQERWETAGND